MFFYSFQITVRREDRRDPLKLYNKMSVGDLNKRFTGVRAFIILITDNKRASSVPSGYSYIWKQIGIHTITLLFELYTCKACLSIMFSLRRKILRGYHK